MCFKDHFTKSIERSKSAKKHNLNVVLIFILIAGLIMGTIFIFGMNYWESPVKRSDAIRINATFLSYRSNFMDSSTSDITINFSNMQQMTVDGSYVDDELLNQLDLIESGTVLQVVKHPNSDKILELVKGGEIIVDFNEMQKKLSEEVLAFTVLGVVLYMFSFFAAVLIFLRYKSKNRDKKVETFLGKGLGGYNLSKKKLFINRDGFTWNNNFLVYDENGLAKYKVEGNFFEPKKQELHIKDMTGVEVALIQHMVLRVNPTFHVSKNKNRIAEIVSNFLVSESLVVKGPDWKVISNTNNHLFCVLLDSAIIVSIDRVRLSSGESYILEFDEAADEVLVVAVVLAIDAVAELVRRMKTIDFTS